VIQTELTLWDTKADVNFGKGEFRRLNSTWGKKPQNQFREKKERRKKPGSAG